MRDEFKGADGKCSVAPVGRALTPACLAQDAGSLLRPPTELQQRLASHSQASRSSRCGAVEALCVASVWGGCCDNQGTFLSVRCAPRRCGSPVLATTAREYSHDQAVSRASSEEVHLCAMRLRALCQVALVQSWPNVLTVDAVGRSAASRAGIPGVCRCAQPLCCQVVSE